MIHDKTASPSHDRLAGRVVQVCDAVGHFVEYWGFKAIHGRVWALLAVRSTPITQAEIAKTLGVSRALVSAAIAELMAYNLVRPTDEHRNAPYEAVMDVWPIIADILRGREWMLLENARLALESVLEEVQWAADRQRPTAYSAERITFLLHMTELAQALLKTIIALRAPRALDGLRAWGSRAAAFIQEVRRQL